MAVYKEKIHERIKGSLMEDESWWHLCYDDATGDFWIEHEWDRVDPYKMHRAADVGSKRIEIDGYSGPGAENIESAREKLMGRASA